MSGAGNNGEIDLGVNSFRTYRWWHHLVYECEDADHGLDCASGCESVTGVALHGCHGGTVVAEHGPEGPRLRDVIQRGRGSVGVDMRYCPGAELCVV